MLGSDLEKLEASISKLTAMLDKSIEYVDDVQSADALERGEHAREVAAEEASAARHEAHADDMPRVEARAVHRKGQEPLGDDFDRAYYSHTRS